METRDIIFFDGVCNFCNSTIDFIWKRNKNKNLYYCSLQSPFANSFLKKNQNIEIELDTIYFFSDGVFYKKSAAFMLILKKLNQPYPLLGIILGFFPKSLANWFYDLVANNRYAILGKKESCRLTSEEEQHFFIT